MRLSEAIRLGAMLKPQGREYLLYEGRSCALGAAADACGFPVDEKQTNPSPVMLRTWPQLSDYSDRPCNVGDCCRVCLGVTSMIIHLNDAHSWTRERIADWVATVEPPEAPPAIERTPDEEFAWVQRADVARAD